MFPVSLHFFRHKIKYWLILSFRSTYLQDVYDFFMLQYWNLGGTAHRPQYYVHRLWRFADCAIFVMQMDTHAMVFLSIDYLWIM